MSNRGPIEYTSIPTAVTFTPPILWIQVVTAGSGGLVVKDEKGTARTYTGLTANDPPLVGPFTEITSMTLSKIRVGDSVPVPPPNPGAAVLGSTTAGNGASTVGIADAGNFTAQTTVEGALQEIYQDLSSAQKTVHIPLMAAILAAGTPMAAFADNAGASAPGVTLNNSKAVGVRWNNFATQTAIWSEFVKPLDMDVTKASGFVVIASKSGATVGDATTFTIACFENTPGALEDAGSDKGGTTGAMTGNATAKTVQRVTLAITANTFAAPPGMLSVSIKPSDGTLGTDDVIVEGFYFVYQRKPLAS